MSTQPLVTVFISCYNRQNFIRESLESVLKQSYKNIEILIIDDCSTDDTLKILAEYQDDRIIILKNSTNMGIPYTRNKGLQNATGKYFAILDSDDICTEDRIEKQVTYLEENQDVVAVGSQVETFGLNKRSFICKYYNTYEELKAQLIFNVPLCNSSAMVRKSIIDSYNIKYNNSYYVCQDYDFWYQIMKIGKIMTVSDVLVKYRVSNNNISKTSQENQEKLINRMRIILEIRSNVLNYYQFKLNSKEIEIFNDFFIDLNDKTFDLKNNLSTLKLICNKIQKNNRTLNSSTLAKVYNDNLLIALNSDKIYIFEKIRVYINIHFQESWKKYLKAIIFIFSRDLYHKVKRIY